MDQNIMQQNWAPIVTISVEGQNGPEQQATTKSTHMQHFWKVIDVKVHHQEVIPSYKVNGI